MASPAKQDGSQLGENARGPRARKDTAKSAGRLRKTPRHQKNPAILESPTRHDLMNQQFPSIGSQAGQNLTPTLGTHNAMETTKATKATKATKGIKPATIKRPAVGRGRGRGRAKASARTKAESDISDESQPSPKMPTTGASTPAPSNALNANSQFAFGMHPMQMRSQYDLSTYSRANDIMPGQSNAFGHGPLANGTFQQPAFQNTFQNAQPTFQNGQAQFQHGGGIPNFSFGFNGMPGAQQANIFTGINPGVQDMSGNHMATLPNTFMSGALPTFNGVPRVNNSSMKPVAPPLDLNNYAFAQMDNDMDVGMDGSLIGRAPLWKPPMPQQPIILDDGSVFNPYDHRDAILRVLHDFLGHAGNPPYLRLDPTGLSLDQMHERQQKIAMVWQTICGDLLIAQGLKSVDFVMVRKHLAHPQTEGEEANSFDATWKPCPSTPAGWAFVKLDGNIYDHSGKTLIDMQAIFEQNLQLYGGNLEAMLANAVISNDAQWENLDEEMVDPNLLKREPSGSSSESS
ncbi:hypothetical protein JX266_003550 [Neoarthrinium moseri]|uniref:uncharacterized protein n=1 Tax=Neoarthrinium moseri TaxID=1658444 RepID=UPI001FDD1515|nr:uncharacterized protein JN550_011876 [Neoarthrinium moseri]KAI1850885.1 hypothetical protein JX266_003550 [Neoarthrinium moseri]KAI1859681.1 hypothetical protein JN550_011876 [Neoarthrinium moseri]